MDSTREKYFEEIITNAGLFKHMKVFSSPTGQYLCCVSNRSLFVYTLASLDFVNYVKAKPQPNCEVLEADGDIVDIFWYHKDIFIVDCSGQFYLFRQRTINFGESIHFEESDIFDDSIKDELKWRLEEKGCLNECKKVLAVSLLSNDCFAILLNSGDHLCLKVFRINPYHEINMIRVNDISAQKGILLQVPSDDVEAEYLRDWNCLENLEDQKFIDDVLFVFCDGIVYVLPLSEKRPFSTVCIYETVPGVVDLHWTKGDSNNKSALQLVLSVGAVISVRPFDEEVEYLPLSNLYGIIYRSANTVFATDCDRCYRVELGENPVYVRFPHRGLVSLCKVPDSQNIILASTLHKSVYWIDIDAECLGRGGGFMLPEKKAMDNLDRAVSRLERIYGEIEKEDDFQKALSLIMREEAVVRKVSFSAKIVQILGRQHVFRLKAIVDMPGVVFLKSVWKVTASLKIGSQCTHSQTFGLLQDVTEDNPFVELVKFNLNRYEDGMKLLLRFFCSDSTQDHFFCTPCGEFDLDATFFMLPLTSLPVSEVGRLVDSMGNVRSGETRTDDAHLCTLQIKLSISTLKLDSILTHILQNSKGLWRSGDWNDIASKNETEVVIFGNVIKISVKEEENGILEICGTDVELCHFVKIGIVKSLPWNNETFLNHDLLANIEHLHHSLEVLQLNPAENSEKLTELYQSLRSETSPKIIL